LFPSNWIMTARFIVAAACLIVCTSDRAQVSAIKQPALALTNAATSSATFGLPQPRLFQAPLPATVVVSNPELQLAAHQDEAFNHVASGVYSTTPYACIVIVPDFHLDDKMTILPADNAVPMPTLQPELHLVPIR